VTRRNLEETREMAQFVFERSQTWCDPNRRCMLTNLIPGAQIVQ